MIGGLVEHDGHPALAIHLAKLGDNESIRIRTHGLSSTTLAEAISELRLMALGCRTAKPLLHTWASPSRSYSEAQWETHRAELEREFGLEGHPCVEVFHLKHGRGGRTAAHVHRVYLRVGPDGKAVRTSYSAIRQEKVSRIAEFIAGEKLTSGCFNSAVMARLTKEGRHEVVDAMRRAGLGERRALAAPTSEERAQSERLQDLAADEVWRRAAGCWRRSDDGPSFVAALAEAGLRVAQGRAAIVLVAPGGATYPLLRSINKGGERAGGTPVRKRDLEGRLRELVFPAAETLTPSTRGGAGVFGINGLERQPVRAPTRDSAAAEDRAPVAPVALESLVPDIPSPQSRQRELNPDQVMALLEFADDLHRGAADKARATREAIEAEAQREVRDRHAAALRKRLAEEFATAPPTIGVPHWRDSYRAELAGLPRTLGAHLKWVDRLDAGRSRVLLRSGTTVVLDPRLARADRASPDTVAVMIAHARTQGWTSITVSGGTPDWQRAMAEAATRAVLAVADEHLAPIVQTTKDRMARELVDRWRQARQQLALATAEQQKLACARALLEVLAEAGGHPGIEHSIEAPGEQERFRADMKKLQVHRSRFSGEGGIRRRHRHRVHSGGGQGPPRNAVPANSSAETCPSTRLLAG